MAGGDRASDRDRQAAARLAARAVAAFEEPALVFDGTGAIRGVNAHALRMLGLPGGTRDLIGADVKDLLYDKEAKRAHARTLPFRVGGGEEMVTAKLLDGSLVPVLVRCVALGDDGRAPYCVVLRDPDAVHGDKREQMRALDEMRRSNDRLRGILSIVTTSTLSMDSFAEFTQDVTNRLEKVFDASAVLLYLAESNGYRLRGASHGAMRMPHDLAFVPQGYGVTSLTARMRRSIRLRAVAGCAEDDAAGIMVDMDTDTRMRVSSPIVGSCSSILATPVFSYDHVMAVVLVVWRAPHVIDAASLPLMDTLAEFLSMEFATAISQFQQTRRMECSQAVDDVRDLVHDAGTMTDDTALAVARIATRVMPAHAILLEDNAWTAAVTARSLDDLILRADPQLPGAAPDVDEPGGTAGAPAREGVTARGDEPARARAGETATDGRDSADGAGGARGETGITLAYREGIGFPVTFDDLFPDGDTSRIVRADDAVGAWAGRHSDLGVGVALRLTPPAFAGETPQYALLLMRGLADPPFDDAEVEFVRRMGDTIARTLSEERERMNDTHIAQALQSGMRNKLPQAPGLTTASLYLSATESAVVGGDFFDLFTLPDSRTIVVIGDVSGKGVESAAMASLVKTALAAYAWDGLDPAQIATSLNNMVCNFSRAETFASLLVVLVDVRARSAVYCSAGHMPGMLVHDPQTDHGSLELLSVQSPVIGAMEDMTYANGTFSFTTGDVLFMYTDGTTEARSPDGAFFGVESLRETLLRAVRLDIQRVPEAVLGEVAVFTQGNLRDDIAMVAVRFDECPDARA
ncbi:SpoIIE family protein phosphatase [bacterium]|nr:SpoIIE family protein phosphatase [bacterium]